MWSEAVDTAISQALEKHMDCIFDRFYINVVVAIVAVVIPFADVIIVGMSVVSTMMQIIVQLFYATFLSRSSAALSKYAYN